MRRAVEYIRAGNGPALVHGHVIRPYSHSLSDDQKLYRPEGERKTGGRARSHRALLQEFLIAEGILDLEAAQKLQREVDAEVHAASDAALDAAIPRAFQLRPPRGIRRT